MSIDYVTPADRTAAALEKIAATLDLQNAILHAIVEALQTGFTEIVTPEEEDEEPATMGGADETPEGWNK